MPSALTFNEAVDLLVQEDSRYDAEAYTFLRDALETTLKKRKKSKKETAGSHVSADELLDGFRLHALKEFGPMTPTVLGYWGVRTCEDVGHLVFNLVKAGIFAKTDQDTMDAFRAGFEFEAAFVTPFRPTGKLLSAGGAGGVG
ncbi:MAG TPA: Minf_1886 family protein [Chthoniobacterales bacterium]